MAHPKFSIVIPTRERHETLKYAIESCLTQDFDDYEIVVCDNYSSAATKQVVDAFASPHIRYFRAEQPLSMQDNWNLAYTFSRGDWVIFIGDDDGLLPFGLRQLNQALRRHDVKAVRWNYAVYSWPNIIAPEFANYLQLCLLRGEAVLDSRATIKSVMQGRAGAHLLPNLYHSAVAREILEEIRSRTGNVFAGYHPDTYTSFAVAYLSERHLSLTIPISVSGFSGASNNIAFSFLRRKHQYAEKHRKENALYGLEMHPWVPDLPTLLSVLADSFLLAKRDLFPEDQNLVFDRKLFAERFVREMPIDDLSEWDAGLAEIRHSLEDDPALLSWFDKLAPTVQPATLARDQFRPKILGYNDGYLHIDTKKCGVSDVAGAARLAGGILNYDRDDLPFDLRKLVVPQASRQRFMARMTKAISRLLRGPARSSRQRV
jgi:glycosyltransferase involved in cell wall biosynthesis